MSFRIKIVDVKIEVVPNGKNKYTKAELTYTFKGETRTQRIMSFANPGIFAKVSTMKQGEEYDVEATKDDKGYTQWAKIVAVSNDPAPDVVKQSAGTPGSASGRTSVSTYETAEERKIKQLYIIRQSSISNAIEYHSGGEATIEDILSTAQTFVDFVFNNDLYRNGKSLAEMDSDLAGLSEE